MLRLSLFLSNGLSDYMNLLILVSTLNMYTIDGSKEILLEKTKFTEVNSFIAIA